MNNGIIGFHAVRKIFLKDVIENGIYRDSSALFYTNGDYKNYLFNTLQVLVYHGVSLNLWNSFYKSTYNNLSLYLQHTNNDIFIVKCIISKKLENKFDRYKLHYMFRENSQMITLPYVKVEDIGKIMPEQITETMKIQIDIEHAKFSKNLLEEEKRFFCKFIGDDRSFCINGISNREIKEFCYQTALINIGRFERIVNES